MVTKANIPGGYKQTEIGIIPEDWGVRGLASIAKVTDSLHYTPSFCSEGYPMVRVADIKTGNLYLNDTLRVTENVFRDFTRNYVPKRGDIVLSRVGSYGVSSFVETDEQFCMGQNTVIIEATLPSRFLYYILNSKCIWQQIEDGSYGSGYKSLSLRNIRELLIPIPPAEKEQQAIAEALSDVDGLIASLDELITKKQNIKQGTMQQLLTGNKRLSGFSREWKRKKLGDLTELYQPVTISASNFKSYGFPVYGANGVVGFYDQFNHETWQVTVTCRGSTCGTVNKTVDRSWITGNAMVVNCDGSKGIDKTFLYFLLLSLDLSVCITGTGQPQIVRSPLANFDLTISMDIKEQIAIAQVLSDMDTEIEALEQKCDKYKSIKQGMMQELLTGKTRLI